MYRANGSDIQGAGIQPDIVVRHNGDMFPEFGTATDPDIAEAIKVLAGDRQ